MVVTEYGDSHEHCWHPFRGAIHMVVPDGHVVVKCCRCPSTTTMHADHLARLCGQESCSGCRTCRRERVPPRTWTSLVVDI